MWCLFLTRRGIPSSAGDLHAQVKFQDLQRGTERGAFRIPSCRSPERVATYSNHHGFALEKRKGAELPRPFLRQLMKHPSQGCLVSLSVGFRSCRFATASLLPCSCPSNSAPSRLGPYTRAPSASGAPPPAHNLHTYLSPLLLLSQRLWCYEPSHLPFRLPSFPRSLQFSLMLEACRTRSNSPPRVTAPWSLSCTSTLPPHPSSFFPPLLRLPRPNQHTVLLGPSFTYTHTYTHTSRV